MKLEIRNLQKKFLRWKHNLRVLPSLERDRFGRFEHSGVQREWAAYMQCMNDILPAEPPQSVLDVMAQQGVRSAWCEDVYKAVRKHMISELEKMK